MAASFKKTDIKKLGNQDLIVRQQELSEQLLQPDLDKSTEQKISKQLREMDSEIKARVSSGKLNQDDVRKAIKKHLNVDEAESRVKFKRSQTAYKENDSTNRKTDIHKERKVLTSSFVRKNSKESHNAPVAKKAVKPK